MIPIKRRCNFLIDKEKGKNDGRLRYRISWSGNIVNFNVGYRVEYDKWSKDTQRCKNNTTHGEYKVSASEINRAIQVMEEDIEDVFYSFEMSETTPTKDEVRDGYNKLIGKLENNQTSTLLQSVFSDFIRNQSVNNDWSSSTIKGVNITKNNIKRFNSNLKLQDIDADLLQRFVSFLTKRGLQNSTVITNTKNIKWLMNWATKNKYNTNLDYLNFKAKLKTVDTKVIFLTWDELMAVYNVNIPESKQYLDRVRDVFCFQCFTSLRYSDVYNLKKNDVREDYIEVVTQKTQDSLLIDLNDYSRSILEKYSAIKIPGNKALPVISNQKMNDYLKELAALAGINSDVTITYFVGNERVEQTIPKSELITTHCGRRTFICNALSLGIPPHVVMKWTGHSDYRAMKPYIDVADNTRLKQMNKFNVDDF